MNPGRKRDTTPLDVETNERASPPEDHRAIHLLRAILHHRLTHFFLLGGILFALTPPPANERTIRLDAEAMNAVRSAEKRKLGRDSLSAEEMVSAEAQAIEDELLYREALRLRIAEGDFIIRQRLIQKLLVLAEDVGGASVPLSDAELRDCFAQHPGKWKLPSEARFVHIYGSSREGVAALRDQANAFSAEPGHEAEIPPLGESFPKSRRVSARLDEIADAYGAEFAAALKTIPAQSWSEPVASKYGWHLVRVLAYAAEKPATLEDARFEVTHECQQERREKAVRNYLGRLFSEYEVFVEGKRTRDHRPTGRIAPRGELSGED